MLRWLGMLLARVLLEAAVTCLIIGALLCLLAWKVGRRAVTTNPDRLERLSGHAATLTGLLPRRTSDPAVNGVDSVEPFEQEEPA